DEAAQDQLDLHPGGAGPAQVRDAGAPLALVDAAHWATEWPWLNLAARSLAAVSDKHDWQLETKVSHRVTDPWTAHAPMPYTA
ncbi:Nif3-like dinuclear metal center hexameric protein, partial [Kitasatospora indigofera]